MRDYPEILNAIKECEKYNNTVNEFNYFHELFKNL